jgi:hypothetical protein
LSLGRAVRGNPQGVGRLLLLVVVALAGCGGSSRPTAHRANPATPEATASRTPDDSEQLQQLLAERAAAMREGDPAALQRTTIGAQRRRDRRAAAAARRLPIARLTVTARQTDVAGDRARIQAVTLYSFAGIDTRFAKRSRITAVRTRAGWRVRSDRALGIKAPWEIGRYTPRRSAHFLALAPAGLDVAGLMTDLERGRARMIRALPGVRPPGRLLVLVARGDADTRALTRDVRTLGSLTALAEARVSTAGPARRVTDISGQRVLVLWRSYGRRPVAERRMVVAHELTHAALARQTSGRTPAWLVEGIAMYASGDQRAGEAGALLAGAQLVDASQREAARRTLSLAALARPEAMRGLPEIPLAVAYSYASAAAYAIAARHGRAGLLRLYRAFNDESIRGRPGRRLDDRVLRRALHESLADVQRDAEAFARAHAS